MATYRWRGTDPRGHAKIGELDAASLEQAAAALRSRGMAPLALDRVEVEPPSKPSVDADAFTLFNRNLSEMTAVGLPLPRAVGELASGLRRGRFKAALTRVEGALREGRSLDEAVAAEPASFPPYYRWMLKAGAASGNLSGTLSAVARYTEVHRLAQRAFLEATVYPAIVLLLALTLVLVGCFAVIPFYRDLAASRHLEVAGLSILIASMEKTLQVGTVVAASALGFALVFFVVLKSRFGERVLRVLPLVGRIRRHLIFARLLGALGVMLRSGVPLPEALPVALGASGSRDLGEAAASLAGRASEGQGLGDILAHAPGMSAEVASFLSVAERTGDAPQTTAHIADLMLEQALSDCEALFVVLMPVALVVAGLVVAGLLIPVAQSYVLFLESLRP